MEQNIPIIIHVPKLQEWLVSRRHCKNDWKATAIKIRDKINAALEDMPENPAIMSLLTGTYINYFHCLKIISILEKTEADSKNMFGSYTSKRMKDWKEIVSMYNKNNIYLSEAAQLLFDVVTFELPSLKTQITKKKQFKIEAIKKEAEALKSANTAKNDLNSFLKELELDTGEGSYKKRIVANANQLTAIHEKAAIETRNVIPALQHYVEFTKVTLAHQSLKLFLVKYIAENGNKTVYEFMNNEAPTQIIPAAPIFSEDDCEETVDDSIDWGFDDVIAQGNAVDERNPGNEIESSETSEAKEEENLEKVAKGDMALTIFENSKTRTQFINQLLEIKAFLKMRIFDVKKNGPNDDFVESLDGLEKMLKSVDAVTDLLLSKTTQHFYNILFLPNYLDSLVSKIKVKEAAIERYHAIAELTRAKAAESVTAADKLTKSSILIISKGKELIKEIQKDISEKYKGRTVTLTGAFI